MPGVRDVFACPRASPCWPTASGPRKKGRDALKSTGTTSGTEARSSDAIVKRIPRSSRNTPGATARNDGDADKALAGAASCIEANYVLPVSRARADGAAQLRHQAAPATAASRSGPARSSRRSTRARSRSVARPQARAGEHQHDACRRQLRPARDARPATWRQKPPRSPRPAKPASRSSWSGRARTTSRGGYYRPAFVHRMRAALDAKGNVVGWQHRIVGQSIIEGTPFAAMTIKNGIDRRGRRRGTLPYADPQSRASTCIRRDRRAGAVVALGRLDAHRVSRPSVLTVRRARDRRAAQAIRLASSAARCWRRSTAPPRRARARGRRRPAGASRSPEGPKRAGIAVHESFNTLRRGRGRGVGGRGRLAARSSASSARSIAASPSTLT